MHIIRVLLQILIQTRDTGIQITHITTSLSNGQEEGLTLLSSSTVNVLNCFEIPARQIIISPVSDGNTGSSTPYNLHTMPPESPVRYTCDAVSYRLTTSPHRVDRRTGVSSHLQAQSDIHLMLRKTTLQVMQFIHQMKTPFQHPFRPPSESKSEKHSGHGR